MVKYALLGATGATGKAILRALIASPPPDLHLNIYVRDKAKLLTTFPDLDAQTPFATTIHTGSNTDRETWKQCLRDVNVIFMCIASNASQRGESRFTDSATAVVEALHDLREQQQQAYQTPTILVLRAITLNEKFNPGVKGPAILLWTLKYLYNNMIAASVIYNARAREEPGLLEVIYVDPPAIHDDQGTTPTGYQLSTEPGDGKKMSGCVSYPDLGVAFVEIAQRRAQFVGQGVVVDGTGKINTTWATNVSFLFSGAVGRIQEYLPS